MTAKENRPGDENTEAAQMALSEGATVENTPGGYSTPGGCGVGRFDGYRSSGCIVTTTSPPDGDSSALASTRAEEIARYFDVVYGTATGYAHVGVGLDGHFSETGSYELTWRGACFSWPDDRADLITAATQSVLVDFYACPYLMKGERRGKDEAVVLQMIHADCDGSLDPAKVRAVDGFAVESGTPGHGHAYVLLSEPVLPEQHEILCRAFGDYLGDADAKIRPSDVLRPTGTSNQKGRALGGESTKVKWMVEPSGVKVEPRVLAMQLGVDLETGPSSRLRRSTKHVEDCGEGKPFDLARYPKIQAAIDRPLDQTCAQNVDRSADTYRILAECKRAGLTKDQGRWAVRQREDLAGRVDERSDDDVDTVWEKLDLDIANDQLTLPPVFWERPVLKRILLIAYAEMASPDAVLGAILATLSASVPPTVRIDSGVRRQQLPVHNFVALVGKTGGFKSSAMDAAKGSVRFVRTDEGEALRQQLGHYPLPGEDIPCRAYPGTAQGIVESFMGEVEEPDPASKTGKPKTVRRQVRTNVLLVSDEGNWLAKELADLRSKVGEILRELWTGVDVGQGNAKSENRRGVRQCGYSFAMLIGFQLAVLGDLLRSADVELGTPQRFVCFWTGAPDLPDDPVNHPGDLVVTIPSASMVLCPALKKRVRKELASRLRAGGSDDDQDSQRLALVARLAAGMAILDGEVVTDDAGQMTVAGRSEITEDDWELAEWMAATSRTIKRHALSQRRDKDARAQRIRRAKSRAEDIEDDELRRTPEGRAKARILAYLAEGERQKWSGKDGIRARFNSAEVQNADAALVQLVESGEVLQQDVGPTRYVVLGTG